MGKNKVNISVKEILSSYNNVGFALYRFPNKKKVHFVIDDAVSIVKEDLNKFSGFILNSFDDRSFIGIHDQYSGKWDGNWDESFELNFIEGEDLEEDEDAFISSMEYKETILDALDNIDKGHFSKVVLSRPIYTETLSYSSAMMLWEVLEERYENAFVSMVKLPYGAIWIGASPETLIESSEGEIRTCSLAGTKWGVQDEANLKWTDKEVDEQKIVTDYIVHRLENEFEKIEVNLKGPYNYPSGHLYHLKTDIKIDHVSDLNGLVNVLHPTPAVCGQPKGNSLDFIRMYEGYDRKFYSGYLGPVNMKDSTKLFVNLRCAELVKESASIYVGGGIVKRSNPTIEWEETEEKAQVIMNLLKV